MEMKRGDGVPVATIWVLDFEVNDNRSSFPAALDRPTTIAARDRGDRGDRGAEGQKGKGDRSDRAAAEVDPDAATFLKTRFPASPVPGFSRSPAARAMHPPPRPAGLRVPLSGFTVSGSPGHAPAPRPAGLRVPLSGFPVSGIPIRTAARIIHSLSWIAIQSAGMRISVLESLSDHQPTCQL
jgi:hypothetical protein